jgi:hypothetical protein
LFVIPQVVSNNWVAYSCFVPSSRCACGEDEAGLLVDGGGGVGGLVMVMKESGGMHVKSCDQLNEGMGLEGTDLL